MNKDEFLTVRSKLHGYWPATHEWDVAVWSAMFRELQPYQAEDVTTALVRYVKKGTQYPPTTSTLARLTSEVVTESIIDRPALPPRPGTNDMTWREYCEQTYGRYIPFAEFLTNVVDNP